MKSFSSTHHISFISQHLCKERIHRLSGCHIRYDATTLMFSPCLRTLRCQDSCFTDFQESTSHLWETMVQVMVWLGQLAELQLVTLDDVENLAEFCRTVLERIGNRPGLFDTHHLAGWGQNGHFPRQWYPSPRDEAWSRRSFFEKPETAPVECLLAVWNSPTGSSVR